jgi:hypothetical protein
MQLADSVTETIVNQANAANNELQLEQAKLRAEVNKTRVSTSSEALQGGTKIFDHSQIHRFLLLSVYVVVT